MQYDVIKLIEQPNKKKWRSEPNDPISGLVKETYFVSYPTSERGRGIFQTNLTTKVRDTCRLIANVITLSDQNNNYKLCTYFQFRSSPSLSHTLIFPTQQHISALLLFSIHFDSLWEASVRNETKTWAEFDFGQFNAYTVNTQWTNWSAIFASSRANKLQIVNPCHIVCCGFIASYTIPTLFMFSCPQSTNFMLLFHVFRCLLAI